MMMRFFVVVIAGLLALTNVANASLVFSFSFSGDSPFVTGSTTGFIYGLEADGDNQQAAYATVVSSPIGSASFIPFNSGTGFDVVGGVIIFADATFADTIHNLSFNDRFSMDWNIFANLTQITGNFRGFEGAEFVNVTAAVPEPATWAMMIFGFVGVAVMGKRLRRAAIRVA